MLKDFLDGIIAIDDKEYEVETVKKMCEYIDCRFDYYNPSDFKDNNTKLKNRRLIFLDLHILQDNKGDVKNDISNIRVILENNLGKDYGAYGIVLWTNHDSEFDIFIEKLDEDKKANRYTMPLFVICCRKVKNIEPEELLNELNDKITKNLAAYFFVKWMNDIRIITENMYHEFYNLLPTYANNSNNFKVILAKIQEQLEHSSQQDKKYDMLYAFKFFDEILNGKLYSQHESSIFEYDSSLNSESVQFKDTLNKKINTLLYFDKNIKKDNLSSGNLYIINNDNSLLDIRKVEGQDKKIIPIAVDLTPPCDIANGKFFYHRLVGGYLLNETKRNNPGYIYLINDISITIDSIEYKNLVLDFRLLNNEKKENLSNDTLYKLELKLMPNIFADILQKFSSHAARLGKYDSIL